MTEEVIIPTPSKENVPPAMICPFCNGRNLYVHMDSEGWCTVRCENCKTVGPRALLSYKLATERWNGRFYRC